MCLMIQSKTSEKCQKVSLLFRVKEILLLFVWSNNHLSKFTIGITFQILVSMFVWAFFLYAMKKDASHSSNKLCVRK